MAIPQWLASILEFFGIKKSDTAKYRRLKEKLLETKAAYVDRLESLKDRIQALERKALDKKREFDTAKGRIKQVVAGEIDRLFKELDRSKENEAIIGQNIDKANIAISKLDSIEDAERPGISEDVFDELAVELQDIFADLKRTDRAAKDLENVQYEAPETSRVDAESRTAELEEPSETTKETAGELPRSTVQRLKELAGEEE